MSRVFSGLIVVVLTVTLSGVAAGFSRPILVCVAIGMMIIYAVVGSLSAKKDAAAILACGQRTYYLGYACTIAALVGLTFSLLLQGHGSLDPRAILVAGLVALSTTLVGLIVLVSLTDYSRSLGKDTLGESDAMVRLAEALDNLDVPPEVFDAITSKAEMSLKGLGSLSALAEQVVRAMRPLPKTISELERAAKNATTTMNQSADSAGRDIKHFSQRVTELNEVIDDYVKLTERNVRNELRAFRAESPP